MAEVTASRNVVLTQRQGNGFVQLNYATTAGQVKTADGGNVEEKLAAIAAEDVSNAVSQAHGHDNRSDLDRLSVVNGQVAVDGAVMKSVIYAASLPDEMPADLVDGGLLIVG